MTRISECVVATACAVHFVFGGVLCVSTFLPFSDWPISGMPLLVLASLSILIALAGFLGMALSGRELNTDMDVPRFPAKGWWWKSNVRGRQVEVASYAAIPVRLRVPLLVVLAAILVTLFSSVLRLEGSPTEKGGEFFVESHAVRTRTLTRAEYEYLLQIHRRCATSILMLFSLIPSVYLFFVPPALRAIDWSVVPIERPRKTNWSRHPKLRG